MTYAVCLAPFVNLHPIFRRSAPEGGNQSPSCCFHRSATALAFLAAMPV